MAPRLSIYRPHAVTLASGAHRISGIILVLFVPFYLWLLQGLAGAPEDFQHGIDVLQSVWGRLSLWAAGVALAYHLLNGVRFLCIDIGWVDSRDVMRQSARLMLAVAAVAAMIFGVLLWP